VCSWDTAGQYGVDLLLGGAATHVIWQWLVGSVTVGRSLSGSFANGCVDRCLFARFSLTQSGS